MVPAGIGLKLALQNETFLGLSYIAARGLRLQSQGTFHVRAALRSRKYLPPVCVDKLTDQTGNMTGPCTETSHDDLWGFESQLNPAKPRKRVVLGVDGGATSTVCVCVAVPLPMFVTDPPILSRAVSGSSNRNSVGEESARRAIEQAMAGALRQAHIPRHLVQAVCLSLAGVDCPSDAKRVLSWLRDVFPLSVDISVHNDSVAALASGTRGNIHGCVLISGTGTIAVGFSSDGRQARAAGFGTLLGDKGSGYAIGQQALAAVMRAHDGRGPPTALKAAILDKLNLATADDLIGWAYADSSWARVAALVPTVKRCAAAGDMMANGVLREAVEELVLSVRAVVKALDLSGKDGKLSFPLVMVGGVLENEDGWDLRKPLMNSILKEFPGAQPISPDVEPAVGAAMVAWLQCVDLVEKESHRIV